MRRKKFSCLSLRRFAQASAAALIALVLAEVARADTLENFFIRDGTAHNVSERSLGSCAAGGTCSFSGKLTVAGRGVTARVTFPGLNAVDDMAFSGPCPPGVGSCHGIGRNWMVDLFSNDFVAVLTLEFSTMQTPGSLVGFEGGSITEVGVGPEAAAGNPTMYSNLSGRITSVLGLSSLAVLGPGLLCCLGLALAWRRSKAAHAQAFGQWRRAHHF